MRAVLGLKSTTAIAAACLMFSTCVAGCTPSPPEGAPPVSSGAPSSGGGAGSPGPQSPDAPVSNASTTPAAPSATGSAPVGDAGQPSAAPSTAITSPGAGGGASGSDGTGAGPGAGPGAGGTTTADANPGAGQGGSQGAGSPSKPGAAVEPSPVPSGSPSTSAAARAAVAPPQVEQGPAVYYVAINDGGSRGVRFGCNDSLVPVRGPASSGDRLTVALGRLLGAGLPVDNDAALYDSLAASSLHFVSGYVSGSTVVVNLGGSLRPGGVCDIPRIEAQLTHTVVAASGASRAEIYVNGMTLEVALSVR